MSPAEALSFLAPAFAACLLFVAIHECFGMYVLRRGVIFVDLALAQVAALGSSVAFAAGYDPASTGSLVYALFFSACGAGLLAFARALPKGVHPEAFIGIIYVVSTALTIVTVDRSPQGAEHVRQMLLGSILSLSYRDLPGLAFLYAGVGALLWTIRSHLARATDDTSRSHHRSIGWDFLFYLSFSVVVSSSVAIAGVLLVFCFLIIPSTIGAISGSRPAAALAIGWLAGAAASAIGLGSSFAWDVPIGAAMVLAFAFVLVLAAVVRPLVACDGTERKRRVHGVARGLFGVLLVLVMGAQLWLTAMPRAAQPLLEVFEALTQIGPQRFLTLSERAAYADALASSRARHAQAGQLTSQERRSRWQGEQLSDESLREIGTFQQMFNEMARGDDFVVRELTARARERERAREAPWVLAACAAGLFLVFRPTPAMRLLRRLRSKRIPVFTTIHDDRTSPEPSRRP